MGFPTGKRILGAGLLAGSLAAAAAGDVHTDRIWDELRQARAAAGVAPLERRPELDELARARAEKIAALEHDRRLSFGEPLQAELSEAGIKRFHRAQQHLDMARGYRDPGRAFVRSWRRYEMSWSHAIAPEIDAVGLATATADDGWVVFVAILLEDWKLTDLRELEREAIASVNRVRHEHGLEPLAELAALTDLARSHSRDMARRGYFDHVDPEGLEPADRAARAGLSFRAFAENIQMSSGSRDPVQEAVASWMGSPGHRAAILDPAFRKTGMGVAIDGERGVYFTQLFLGP